MDTIKLLMMLATAFVVAAVAFYYLRPGNAPIVAPSVAPVTAPTPTPK